MKTLSGIIVTLAVFSIAMGFMESAVVVYLRELYYPNRFEASLHPMTSGIAITELLRELATIIMLAYLGIMNGKNFAQRFAFFLFSFAIWDIFYYVFLKAILNWPGNILDWDILFLIPVPWFGPVLAPCLISLTMIAFALTILNLEGQSIAVRFRKGDWGLMVFACLIYIYSFTSDCLRTLSSARLNGQQSGNEFFYQNMRHFIPAHYNWYLFALATAMLLTWMYFFRRRHSIGSGAHQVSS